MTTEEKFNYWFEYAQNDLETAEAMFKTGRWTYVWFTCQQALEKLVKGLYLFYVDDNIPKLHDISAVFGKYSDKLKEKIKEDYLSFFDSLSNFYLRSRYPDYAKVLLSQTTEESSKSVLEKAKEVYRWLLTMKP
jgi:HEPN domain-containing protein